MTASAQDAEQQLQHLIREAFAARDLHVTVEETKAVDDRGRQFWLGTLIRDCLDGVDPAAWPELVRERVDRSVGSITHLIGLEAHGLEYVQRRAMPMVLDAADFPDPAATRHAPEVLPGYHLFIGLDLPEGVHILSADGEDDLGGAARLRAEAMRNLRALEVRSVTTTGEDGDGAAAVVLSGPAPFVPGLVAVLDEMVLVGTGTQLPPDGALVAVPDRGRLLLHPIRDAGVLPSLDIIARYAREAHAQADEPLSPQVYWWRPHQVTRLTSGEGDELVLEVDDAFQAVLDRVTAQPPPGTAPTRTAPTRKAVARTEEDADPDPVGPLADDALDFDRALDLTRSSIEADDLPQAAAIARRALDSPDPQLRAAGELATALVHLAEGNPKSAMKRLQRMGESTDPDIAAEVYVAKGMAFQARRKWADADAHYRFAMSLPRTESGALAALHLGRMLAGTGQEDEAGRMFHTAVNSGVPRVTARAALELALALERVGRPEAAAGHYRTATRSTRPEIALRAAFNLAGVLRETGDPEHREESHRLLERVHDSGDAQYAPKAAADLALAHLGAGRMAEAVACFEEATTSPDRTVSALAHLHLGIVTADGGDPVRARHLLRIAEKTATGEVKQRATRALHLLRSR